MTSHATRRVAVIPARGGSKRIPGKNVRDFRGKPVIAYTIEAARQSALFHTVHVSTDSEQVAAVASKHGARPAFMRSPGLADDHTPIMPVVRDAVERFAERGLYFDEVWILMACAPLLLPADLNKAAELYHRGGGLPVLAVTRYPAPVEWAFALDPTGKLTPVEPGMFARRSQDLMAKYYDAGMFSVFSVSRILQSADAGDDMSFLGYVMPPTRVTDIDDESDWQIAEALFDALQRTSSAGS